MASPKPFQISIPQSKIDTLRTKLSLAEFPNELDEAGWDMGVPLTDMKRLTKAWEQWDWRPAENELNKVPQFTTDIDVDGFETLNIHFVHQKSEVKEAIPLLFVHGWPGSFIEVLKLLPLLAEPNGPAFHVIAPSLPNYGFSQGVPTRGFGAAQYAETCHKLMLQLGYKEYVTQGGDWGFYITRAIAKLFPQSCKANHINLIRATAPTFSKNPLLALQHAITPYTEKDKKGFERTAWFNNEGRGYFMEQATKPQTLTYCLHDSPVALLAWIYEKLHDWTDSYAWTDDEIFTWISIYQFSRAGPGAAHRIYYEVMHTKPTPGKRTFIRPESESYIGGVKLGLCYNPKEISILPKTWGRTLGEVVYESDNEHGGHFQAHEHPEVITRDLKAMFGKGGGAYGVVPGKDGYSDETARARL